MKVQAILVTKSDVGDMWQIIIPGDVDDIEL